jgi:hypothetical protein
MIKIDSVLYCLSVEFDLSQIALLLANILMDPLFWKIPKINTGGLLMLQNVSIQKVTLSPAGVKVKN